MKYWIRVNRVDHGPWTAGEIVEKLGSALPVNTPCAIVGEYKWATLGELLPAIGRRPPVAEPPLPHPSPAVARLVNGVIFRVVVIFYSIILLPVVLPLLYIIHYTSYVYTGVVALVCFLIGFVIVHLRFNKIGKSEPDLSWSQTLLRAIFLVRPPSDYTNPFVSPPPKVKRD